MDKVSNKFLNKLDIGAYEYYVRDLPLHGSYVEVFKSDYNHEIEVLFNFNASNYDKAEGVFYLVNEIYELITDVFYKDNRGIFPSYLRLGPAMLHTIDDSSFKIKFISDVILDNRMYPKDRVANVLSSFPNSNFKSFIDNIDKFFKFAKDFKVTEKQTERIIENIVYLTEKNDKYVNECNLKSYEVNRCKLSRHKSIEEWKKLTSNDVNSVINNLFSVFSLTNIEILCPKSVSINDIDKFIDTFVEDSLNAYLDAKSGIGVSMTKRPSIDEYHYSNIKLLDKELYHKTRLKNDYIEWKRNRIEVEKTNRDLQSIIITTPLISTRKSFVIDTDGADEICGYLSGDIILNMFTSYIRSADTLLSSYYGIKEPKLFKIVKDDTIYTSFAISYDDVFKRVNLKELIDKFDDFLKDHIDDYLETYINNLMRDIRKFTCGLAYRQSLDSLFESNMYTNIVAVCNNTTAAGRSEIVSKYLGNNDDLLFPEYSQFLTNDTFITYLKQAVMQNKDELRFKIFVIEE